MIQNFHFLRPEFLFLLILLFLLAYLLKKRSLSFSAWEKICDKHLFAHLHQVQIPSNSKYSTWCLLGSFLFMILAAAGPTWYKLPVPTYKVVQPHVLILDMSDSMLEKDLTPNRLERAKFKMRDLFSQHEKGQFALIAYTGEPFLVSPLTDDAETINALLPSLSTNIMPVAGENLDNALSEAAKLITQAGFHQGKILVFTARSPSSTATSLAKDLSQKQIQTSIMPMLSTPQLNPLFKQFAHAGKGQLIPYSANSEKLQQWLDTNSTNHYSMIQNEHIPLWKDEGRWFLLPALILLLPFFQRGWIERIKS